MRVAIFFFFIFLFSHLTSQATVFIFKSGKSIQGTVKYESDSTIRVVESSGLEMTLRKSELNLAATAAANVQAAAEEPATMEPVQPAMATRKSTVPVKIYTNRDLRVKTFFSSHEPESAEAWKKSIAKMEREFSRLQGSCRGAGAEPGKILRSDTYTVRGKEVRVTGYWADPANIENAKRICDQAIQTEVALQQAHERYHQYLEMQKNQNNSVTAR